MDTTPFNYETLALRENPDAVIVTSLEGEILHWSEGASRVFGYSRGETLGRTLRELIVPVSRLDEEIVSDLQMPGIDGYELAWQLLGNPHWRRVPLIAVSAFSMRGDRERALAAGFDGYFAKPISPEMFVREITAFLPPALRAGVRKTE